jgi:hypothetical protein
MDVEFLGNGDNRMVSALLFLAGGGYALNAMSSLNSSPWTSENFGADTEKAKSSREYVRHALVVSTVFAGVATYIAHNWWPMVGNVAIGLYMFWLYERALARGAATASDGWANE